MTNTGAAHQTKQLLRHLADQAPLQTIIESYEGCLYQAFVRSGNSEQLLWIDSNTPLRSHSLTALREQIAFLNITSLHLRQNSAYDEMVGQPLKAQPNTLLIPLSTSSWLTAAAI